MVNWPMSVPMSKETRFGSHNDTANWMSPRDSPRPCKMRYFRRQNRTGSDSFYRGREPEFGRACDRHLLVSCAICGAISLVDASVPRCPRSDTDWWPAPGRIHSPDKSQTTGPFRCAPVCIGRHNLDRRPRPGQCNAGAAFRENPAGHCRMRGAVWQRLRSTQRPRTADRDGQSGHPVEHAGITQSVAGPVRRSLEPLFPQGNPAQQRYPAWPASYDASLRVSWRQLQPADPGTLPPDAPDDRKFDFSVIDDALTKLAARNMRLILRVVGYNSCCDIRIRATPTLRFRTGCARRATNYPGPQNDPASGVTQVVPNWNDPQLPERFRAVTRCAGAPL